MKQWLIQDFSDVGHQSNIWPFSSKTGLKKRKIGPGGAYHLQPIKSTNAMGSKMLWEMRNVK